MRLDPGPNPPATALAEIHDGPLLGFAPRGADIDSQGCVGVARQRPSLQLRPRKCKDPLNGPKATCDHCPEGWAFYQYPGRGLPASAATAPRRAITPGSISTIRSGSATTCRPRPATKRRAIGAGEREMSGAAGPYTLSFYATGIDGRIDDPNARWKGRGVWTTSGDRAPWLKEGGKGTVSIALHFQFRPNPLAD